MLRNIVFIGGPRDGISTWMDAPQFRIMSPDRNGNEMTWHEYTRLNQDGDVWAYQFQSTHEGPLSYAVDVLDHWLEQQFPSGFQGWMVDVGAYDGITGSNSLYLEELGWKCLCVEPNGNLMNELRLRRPLVEHCACSDHDADAETLFVHLDGPAGFTALVDARTADLPDRYKITPPGLNWAEQQVKVRTLDSLLESYGFPQLDVLSVDTEGTELDVLKGIDLEKWHPKVIVCEAWEHVNPTVPYLSDRGYRLIERRDVNNLFLYEGP